MSTPKEAIEQMYALMSKHSEFGASDTEPRPEFAQILRAQLEGREANIPTTARGWQLYSDMPGNETVARELHDKTVEVLRIANGDHRGFVESMKFYF